jgi:protein phosphatase-4 regulatory subunit 3
VLLDHHTAGVRVHIGQQAHLLQQHPYNTSKDATARVEAHPSQQQLQAQENADKRKVLLSPSLLPFKESIMQVLCRMLADSQELALQNQLADALRMVLEIPPQQLEMVEMVSVHPITAGAGWLML